MLWTIFSILIVVWIIGVFTESMGGFIHVLLVLALLALATELALAWRRREVALMRRLYDDIRRHNYDEATKKALLARSEEADVKELLKSNTDELISRGGFGSPTMFVDKSDMYFGNDRLPLVEAALRRAG